MSSRVIKFRAFDTQRNVMYSAAELGRDEMQLHPDGRGFFNASSVSQRLSQYYSHLLPMQSTGLCDKNGKEIYEGDIIQWGGEAEPVVVAWSSMYASFGLHRYGWMSMHYFGEAVDSTDCEVIGNVHQNPELLK